MRALATGSFVVAVLLLLSTPAFSQPAVAGLVRDSSGRAEHRAESAVCAVQCDLQLLSTAHHRKGGFLCEGVALKSCCEL